MPSRIVTSTANHFMSHAFSFVYAPITGPPPATDACLPRFTHHQPPWSAVEQPVDTCDEHGAADDIADRHRQQVLRESRHAEIREGRGIEPHRLPEVARRGCLDHQPEA